MTVKTRMRVLTIFAAGTLFAAGAHPSATDEIRAHLASAQASRTALAGMLPSLRAKGVQAYAEMQLVTLDKFLKWISEEDIPGGWTNRVEREAREVDEIGQEAVVEARRVLDGTAPGFPVPRYVTSPVTLFHAQTLATRRWSDGRVETNRPVFFYGFGHFSRVRNELEDLPALGYNTMQFEVDWRVFQPRENLFKPAYAEELFLRTADRAVRNNCRIDLLLSPHYFPGWAKEKWPDAKNCSGGFFGYCVHNPEIRQAVRRYFRKVVSIAKDHPALNSFCVANEPESMRVSGCPFVRREFADWLARRYGAVDKMNALWRTDYKTFADVPIPVHPDLPAKPEALEFVRFNRETFSNFLGFLAACVREEAPAVPLHAKVVTDQIFTRGRGVFWSIDIERLAELFDYLDGDPLNFFVNWGDRPYLNRWVGRQAGYEFMRSMADKPIFNSENHNIEDRWRLPIPGEHIYSALWQDAVHGQSHTAVWTYERAIATNQTCFGLILERPRCFYAQNRCALDLNRLADKLAPIQNQKYGVVVLWSLASQVMSGGDGGKFLAGYAAASMLGQQVGVVTERRLEAFVRTGIRARPLDDVRVVILPDITHLSEDAYLGLRRLEKEGVAVVACGKPLTFDDFGNERAGRAFPSVCSEITTDAALADALFGAMGGWNMSALPRVRAIDSDRPVFGVETHGYVKKDKIFLSVVNHLRKAVDVRLPGAGVDLITGRPLAERVTVPPLMPIFAEVGTDGRK